MHFNINRVLFFALATCVAMSGCKKDPGTKAPLLENQNDAYVRVIHVAPSFRQIFSNRDTFNVYAGSARINSPFLTYNSFFPGSTVDNYVALPAGNQLFRFSVPGVVNYDSVTLYSFTKNLLPGQRYSLIITDSIKNTNEAAQMWLRDDYTVPVPGQFGIRFVNAVINDTAGKTVDLYSVKLKGNMFTNVKGFSATGFHYYNTTLNADTLIVRRSGVTTWELARLPLIGTNAPIPYSSQHVYTYIYRGDTKLTTGTKGRGLTSYLNY
jgi:hypothetical protein